MKKALEWLSLALLALVLVGFTGLSVGVYKAEHKMKRKVAVHVLPVAYVNDAAHIARGRYLFESRGCTDCHGENAGSRELVHDPNGLHVVGPNLTLGKNSAVVGYSEIDWVRAIGVLSRKWMARRVSWSCPRS